MSFNEDWAASSYQIRHVDWSSDLRRRETASKTVIKTPAGRAEGIPDNQIRRPS